MKHVTPEQLSARLDRALEGRAAEEVERHLAACETCRAALAALTEQEAALGPALTHDPGEAYFEEFSARVEDRIRAAGLAGAQARQRRAGPGRPWNSPRALAWAGAAATVVVVAGLALIMGREVRPPQLRDRALPESAAPHEPVAGAPTADERGAPAAGAPRARRATEERLQSPQAEERRDFLTGHAPAAAEKGSAAPGAAPPAPAASSAPAPVAGNAAPARAQQVRQNEAGEPIPVRAGREVETRFAKPPPASAEDQLSQIRKKLAEPMKAEAPKQTLAPAPSNRALAWDDSKLAAESTQAGAAAGSASALGVVTREEVAAGESRLCGEVRDASGRPVAGAQVALADLARTATTDGRGMFCLGAPAGEHPLSVMAVGFAESRQTVQVGGQESAVRVTLASVPVLEQKPPAATWGRIAAGYRSGGAPPMPLPSVEPRDAYAALPDSVRREVRSIQQLDQAARSRRSAALYDASAGRWEQMLRRVAGGSSELETRWHLAEARYHAWEAGPTVKRAAAAVEALTAYALRAPAGPNRDQAARWLDRVRR